MKTKYLSVLLALIASPALLSASPQSDRKIEEAAKSSYNFSTVLSGNVIAKSIDGNITLSGKVQDQGEKDLAADTVKQIPGVDKVQNNLEIESKYKEHSDAWMAFKVRSMLLVKANVSAASTDVSVEDGVVTLRGTARNEAQKELTGIYAKEIDWVKSVTNNIEIEVPSDGEESVAELVDDASITAQVKFALLNSKSTHALKTSVSTIDGVVVLGGVAASDAARSLAGKLAKDVRGVKSVTNNMTVKG
ncbi:BON domain-containing protein [Pelagicoccus sp. NFK12]|uniref:BON domain-containing protein n=1 Tax=Pelagicoccus enzymogenes TaxID=2773457 RepID=A0A927F7D3_9BACT|nr:BON domain-containing protein [Pelagicoccus enzymogenes]MBD5779224.1 BON domain-containing protein [Pelagicoccus enzymogenes]